MACSTAPKTMCSQCHLTPARNGIHGDRCCRCTLHVPTIQLLDDTVDSLDILIEEAAHWLRKNDPTDGEWIQKYVCYIMMGTTGQNEIDQDEQRMIDNGLMDGKLDQVVTYVEQDEFHSSEHDAARDAERYCIRTVGVKALLNIRQGGAGRTPNDTSVGGVFVLVGVKYGIKW